MEASFSTKIQKEGYPPHSLSPPPPSPHIPVYASKVRHQSWRSTAEFTSDLTFIKNIKSLVSWVLVSEMTKKRRNYGRAKKD